MASNSKPLERAKRTRRHIAWIKRFAERQQKLREWINFAEIAEWCSEADSIEPNEVKREWALKKLRDDLLDGVFEDKRSRVHFLYVDKERDLPVATVKRVTPEWLGDVIDYDWSRDRGRFILEHCWFSRRMFKRWLERHGLPTSPPRFEPVNEQPLIRLQKLKRGRPPEYKWEEVKKRLPAYVLQHGPVQTMSELVQICADIASELNLKGNPPNDKTTRQAITTHGLAGAAGFDPGK